MELTASARKVADAATALGIEIAIIEAAEPTRTAEEAAARCGCDVAQIVKSLVFRGARTGTPVLLLVSGRNRVDEAFMAEVIGEPLARPNGADVRDLTGFAIGGIPPFGHATQLSTYMDQDLAAFDVVWAAAGNPRAVFSIAPSVLARIASARIVRVAPALSDSRAI